MSVRSRRLVVAAILAATAIAVPTAALASGSGTPPGKPGPSASAVTGAIASKSAAASGSAGSAAAGKSPGPPSAAVERVAESAMVASLATQLGVSHGAAQHALDQVNALSGPGDVDPASPAFAAIARGLGVSPDRLAAALTAAKQAAGQAVASM
jgi:hypothetical protein